MRERASGGRHASGPSPARRRPWPRRPEPAPPRPRQPGRTERLDLDLDVAHLRVLDKPQVLAVHDLARRAEVREAEDVQLLPADVRREERRRRPADWPMLTSRALGAAAVAQRPPARPSGSITSVGPSPPHASLNAATRSSDSSETTASAPSRFARSSASGRRPPPRLDQRRAGARPASPRAPPSRSHRGRAPRRPHARARDTRPAASPRRPQCRAPGQHRIDVLGKRNDDVLRHRQQLGEPAVARDAHPGAVSPHERARRQRLGLDTRPTTSLPGTKGSGGCPP